MSLLNELNEQIPINNDNENKNNNIDENEQKVKQPLYKIVQHVTLAGMREEDFYTLNTAVAHWESLTYLLASIWYQFDKNKKTWNIKDSYGTVKATQKIIDYMNNKYNKKQNDNINISAANHAKQASENSLLAYFTSFVSNESNDNNNEPQSQQKNNENIALLDEFFKWTEIYTAKSGVTPLNNLTSDDVKCNDLIVSLVWSIGFQCYYLQSFSIAQQTWKSLGVWYSSVWFTRNAMGTFVVHDNFGTSDSLRRICRFVNEAQETWNYIKMKKKNINVINNLRPLNDNNDSIIIGKEKEKEIEEEKKKTDDELGTYDDEDNKLCIVCIDGNRDHIIIPCGHICICVQCKHLYEKDNATCPMCRCKVEKVIKTFN